ncbi:unnamed protein product [Darwinula stevensoni]|uniref:SEA domain-containing protein n=1 Tax=Darwinula stevensoni TaxID=69355 RepID=A0A7R9FQK9_9CRUS|nr:unnamed protein product [Darwinula stevensoni]CAG0899985.1 unnamed protein product [Darwinula stevensoni]
MSSENSTSSTSSATSGTSYIITTSEPVTQTSTTPSWTSDKSAITNPGAETTGASSGTSNTSPTTNSGTQATSDIGGTSDTGTTTGPTTQTSSASGGTSDTGTTIEPATQTSSASSGTSNTGATTGPATESSSASGGTSDTGTITNPGSQTSSVTSGTSDTSPTTDPGTKTTSASAISIGTTESSNGSSGGGRPTSSSSVGPETSTKIGSPPTSSGCNDFPQETRSSPYAVKLFFRGFHITNIPWNEDYATVGSRDFKELCCKIEYGIVSALSGSSERPFYQRTVCLANRQGSVISDFNMEFTPGVNLGKVQDDIDAKALMPDGTYRVGELRTDYLPSGRPITTTSTTGPPDIVKVQSDRESRLLLFVTLPCVQWRCYCWSSCAARQEQIVAAAAPAAESKHDHPGPCLLDLASWTLPPGPRFLDLASWTLPPGPRFLDLASWTLPPGPRLLDHASLRLLAVFLTGTRPDEARNFLFCLWIPRVASTPCGNANDTERHEKSDPIDSRTEEEKGTKIKF